MAQERGHREGRPAHIQTSSLQSSSVPSTPRQLPRDLRFQSRSPSPTKGLPRRHSPQSAVEPKHGSTIPEQPAQVICKFETGAEFRKRRIPYKDGGNEPLPQPAVEPKTSLSKEEEAKLTEEVLDLYKALLPTQDSDSRRAQLVQKLEKILRDEWPGHDIKVNVFGSSGNLLASNDSDVDICITTSLRSLESMHGIATVLHQHGMERVVCRSAAKVPIVKIWDPELQLSCDMNVNNTMALDNTRMMKTYVQLDDRVRPLAKVIKHWTKQRILNDAAFGGTISSYTWICMIINFLQTRDPPILPSLQQLDGPHRSTINGQPSPFADNLETLKELRSANSESLGSLLFHFFRYYAYELDYSQSVVSVKSGRVLSRKEKGWDVTNYQDKEARVRLCVEEPFTTNRNLGNSADDYAFSGIHEEIRRAFDLVADGKLQECCAEFIFPPEEKPLFQRPPPRPKPTLTRSASQSGRGPSSNTGAGKGAGKDSRNNRTNSSHRSNNRRASSGATYSNNRYGFTSPAMGIMGPDYFGATAGIPNDQLHEQLYKQYQYLQAQQELLRSQLLQQQNYAKLQAQQSQSQLRGSDQATASPRQRQASTGMLSGRTNDSSPATAPLLTGYLYHYPARYSTTPASPMTQTRSQDGSLTLPSSPSLPTNVGSYRRGKHRANAADGGASSSVRSQSQPGRSFPNQTIVPRLGHPGFDVSGTSATPYYSQAQAQSLLHLQQQTGYDVTSPFSAAGYGYPYDPSLGYYVTPSPQLMAQTSTASMSSQSSRTLRDSAAVQTPQSPTPHSPSMQVRRNSRSPSPMADRRGSTTSLHSKSAPLPRSPFLDTPRQQPAKLPVHDHGPIIVNGSTQQSPALVSSPSPAVVAAKSSTPVSVESSGIALVSKHGEAELKSTYGDNARTEAVKASTDSKVAAPVTKASEASPKKPAEHAEIAPSTALQAPAEVKPTNPWHSGVSITAALRARPPPPLSLVLTKSNEESKLSAESKKAVQSSPVTVPPLLSPVAEMRTPSPVSSRGRGSPQADGKAKASGQKAAQAANGKLNEKIGSVGKHNAPMSINELMPENPSLTLARQPLPVSTAQTASEWQQATRKHRKAKSQGITTALKEAGVASTGPGSGERKGG